MADLVQTQPQSRTSRLISLPTELPNRIYELALISHTDIETPSPKYSRILQSQCTTFLTTCRLIRQEASAIYYVNNVFVFAGGENKSDSISILASWLSVLEPTTHRTIRKICLDDYWYSTDKAISRIQECHRHLKKNHVEIEESALYVELETSLRQDVDVAGWVNLSAISARG